MAREVVVRGVEGPSLANFCPSWTFEIDPKQSLVQNGCGIEMKEGRDTKRGGLMSEKYIRPLCASLLT